MATSNISESSNSHSTKTSWSAVISVAIGVAGMIASEILPVSLLTPMAKGLGISEGMAGQSVAVTAFTAIFASLFITVLTRGMNRKHVVVSFSIILAVSNILVAIAPNYSVLLIARILLGFGMGGFWALSASLAMRLAQPQDVPKALSIIFGGVSVSLVIAAPAGSFLEIMIGWRAVFLATSLIGVVCLAWQLFALPSMDAPEKTASIKSVFDVLKVEGVTVAMLAILTVFTAQMALLTYIRPVLEQFSHINASNISTLLLVFGCANFCGTAMSSTFLKINLKAALALPPLITFFAFTSLYISGGMPLITVASLILWGVSCGIVPVAWSTWVTKNLKDDAENAGSLQVAVIQVANTLGAALGGFIFDDIGVKGPMIFGMSLMMLTTTLITFKLKPITSQAYSNL